jgi:hypothetical protein
MIYEPESTVCACGHDAIFRQPVHYSYPRAVWLPEATHDPWRIHGGGYSIRTCGNPQCEPAVLGKLREQIIDDHVLTPRPWLPSGLSAEQMTELVLEVAPC